MFRLPDRYRKIFRSPFGDLYSDLASVVPVLRGRMVFTVGDVVTRNLVLHQITPDIAIIDGHTMRLPCNRTPVLLARRLQVTNPAGTITDELIDAIHEALSDPPALIFVEGEEDLAVIPLVIAAPIGSVVLYGQPNEGVVVRVVDEESKKQAEEMFSLFERVESA